MSVVLCFFPLHLEARLLSLTSSSDLSVFSAVTDAYQMDGRGCSCWLVRSFKLQVWLNLTVLCCLAFLDTHLKIMSQQTPLNLDVWHLVPSNFSNLPGVPSFLELNYNCCPLSPPVSKYSCLLCTWRYWWGGSWKTCRKRRNTQCIWK